MAKNITVYSTPACHFCNKAKEYFTENNIAFTDVNVAADQQKAQEMMQKSGQMGVPVIEIGEDIVVGFNKPVIEKLLNE